MDISQLTLDLGSKFNVVCLCDLADAVLQHRSIFDIFKFYYQAEYQSNQRLIFYTSQKPSQLVLNHLQRAATKIDISNYFLAVCGPIDIEHELKIANQKYGNDSVSIRWLNYKVDGSLPIDDSNIHVSDSLCPLPFGMLVTTVDNSVFPCCKYKKTVGDVNTQSLKEIFHGKEMSDLRNAMKLGEKPNECRACWKLEEKNNISIRQHFVNKYIDKCDQEWIDDLHIRDLTVNPSNLCNFKCRVCSPQASSKIAVEEFNFATNVIEKQKLKKYINIAEKENSIFDDIDQLANKLESLHFLGGEPLAWPQLPKVLDKIIKLDYSQNIQLVLNTNGSWYSENLIEKFKKFKYVEILISIDDLEERFELQRGGQWTKVHQHICQFKNIISSAFKVRIAITVNIQNVLYLDQLVDFCNQLNLEIFWGFLDTPQILSIDFMTQQAKDLVYQKYKTHANSELRAIAERMKKSKAVSGQAFIEYMNKLDLRRNQNSQIVLREIFDAMSC